MSHKERPQDVRYHCKSDGCGKTFLRREHLVRHARTHENSQRFICKVCQKSFTRSDSLQRHLSLHGDEFKPAPSGRSKRACTSCHLSKIKCSAEQPCSRCRKKGIECSYDQVDSDDDIDVVEDPPDTVTPRLMFGYHVSQETDHHEVTSPVLADAAIDPDPNTALDDSTAKSFQKRLSAALDGNRGSINWMSVSFEKNPESTTTSFPAEKSHIPVDASNWPSVTSSEQALHLRLYFADFHHRWPVLHAPTFEEANAPSLLLAMLNAVGAFLRGTAESKAIASDLHALTFHHLLLDMSRLSHAESLDNSYTLGLCQASLLYIILGFYRGNTKDIHKPMIARSMLVTALREMGLFKSELPVAYDKPGYFLPLRVAKDTLKQRLSICLFKIDYYLSNLCGQPQILTAEELHFTLPGTYALWNAADLGIWETRYSIEPQSRGRMTIKSLICEPTPEFLATSNIPILIEDIQLGICAVGSRLWSLRERQRDGLGRHQIDTTEKDVLKMRLDGWKCRIDQLPIHQTDHVDFTPAQHIAMRYYYGVEDHHTPGWQPIVLKRPKTLTFDTLMLYRLASMHFLADIRDLTQLAKDMQHTARVTGEMHLKAREQRELSARTWAQGTEAKRAVVTAVDVLVSFHNISSLEHNNVDPIAFVALSTGALVLSTYCRYSANQCAICRCNPGEMPHSNSFVVAELTKWSAPKLSQLLLDDKEYWIETGKCPGALTGIVLCRCNIQLLMAKYRSCIREEWDLVDSIAPGIFTSLS